MEKTMMGMAIALVVLLAWQSDTASADCRYKWSGECVPIQAFQIESERQEVELVPSSSGDGRNHCKTYLVIGGDFARLRELSERGSASLVISVNLGPTHHARLHLAFQDGQVDYTGWSDLGLRTDDVSDTEARWEGVSVGLPPNFSRPHVTQPYLESGTTSVLGSQSVSLRDRVRGSVEMPVLPPQTEFFDTSFQHAVHNTMKEACETLKAAKADDRIQKAVHLGNVATANAKREGVIAMREYWLSQLSVLEAQKAQLVEAMDALLLELDKAIEVQEQYLARRSEYQALVEEYAVSVNERHTTLMLAAEAAERQSAQHLARVQAHVDEIEDKRRRIEDLESEVESNIRAAEEALLEIGEELPPANQ